MKPISCLAGLLAASVCSLVQAQLTSVCISAAPEPCLYEPVAIYNIGHADFMLQDAARNNHLVPIRVYYPKGAAGMRPVVIWHHGGGSEPTPTPPGSFGSKQGSSRERGESFAAAGYVSIHVMRRMIDNPSNAQLALCVQAGVLPAVAPSAAQLDECKDFLGSQIEGPNNALFVRNLIAPFNGVPLPAGILPDFIGGLDLTKIVVGGWSGGTGVMFSHAGVTRTFGAHQAAPVPIPGTVAFFADSPQGADYAGFRGSGLREDSYYVIDGRPFMFFSGRGDETGEPAESRSAAWLASTPGNKFLSWVNNKDAIHETMDLTGCAGPQVDLCRWMKSAGVAFLDAAVVGRPLAVDWMKSDAYRTLTGGKIEMNRR